MHYTAGCKQCLVLRQKSTLGFLVKHYLLLYFELIDHSECRELIGEINYKMITGILVNQIEYHCFYVAMQSKNITMNFGC